MTWFLPEFSQFSNVSGYASHNILTTSQTKKGIFFDIISSDNITYTLGLSLVLLDTIECRGKPYVYPLFSSPWDISTVITSQIELGQIDDLLKGTLFQMRMNNYLDNLCKN